MILEARDISFSYERKGAELFSNIKFKVENNERVWVPGPSGYGKTTLCKILAGYLEPSKGQVLLDGKPLPKKGYCPVQMIWQHPERAVNPRLKMEKILCLRDPIGRISIFPSRKFHFYVWVICVTILGPFSYIFRSVQCRTWAPILLKFAKALQ